MAWKVETLGNICLEVGKMPEEWKHFVGPGNGCNVSCWCWEVYGSCFWGRLGLLQVSKGPRGTSESPFLEAPMGKIFAKLSPGQSAGHDPWVLGR